MKNIPNEKSKVETSDCCGTATTTQSPSAKDTIHYRAQFYCDMARDYNILFDMLPTKMTQQQNDALARIVSSLRY